MLELNSEIFLNTLNQGNGYLKQHYVEIKCKLIADMIVLF